LHLRQLRHGGSSVRGLAREELAEILQELVRMSGDVTDPIRLADHSVGVDQVRAALGPVRVGLVGMPLRLVRLADLPVDVGQDPEREAVLRGERQVLLRGVEGRADELRADPLEVRGSVTEPPPLKRSPRRVGLHEPPENHPVPTEIGQLEGLPMLIRQREVGSVRPFGEHERSLRQYARRVIEVTEWAREILGKSQAAVRRFTPDAVIRLVSTPGGVEARIADGPEATDSEVDAGKATVFAEAGLEGVIDVEEPHDRIVLKPPGSPPNERAEH
jgi:hypothetical protein